MIFKSDRNLFLLFVFFTRGENPDYRTTFFKMYGGTSVTYKKNKLTFDVMKMCLSQCLYGLLKHLM